MKTFFRRLSRKLNGLPRVWLATFGLAALGVGLYFGTVQPDEQKLARLQRQVDILEVKSVQAGKANHLDPRRQLTEFYRQFPTKESAPDWLAKIEAAAEKHRLQLLEGDYRLANEPSARLTRYQITLPLNGAYPDIRGFLKEVLSEVPAVALDNVSFERRKIGDSTVTATIKMTLYLRRTS